jgi:cullin 1|mmetsp:Transcript_101832/g.172529  ORF Transcript_101832/g.172529 Transcript_101832/m.172529 type:complete len:768 (-) Transcript_101832:75-2378(-)
MHEVFDQEKFEEDWQTLEAGFQRLLEAVESGFVKVFDNPAYMKLYAIVYNLCTKNRLDVDNESSPQATEILYQRYGELLKKYLEERRTWEEGPAFLPTLVKRWTNHKLIVQTMEKLFAYLDRYYTKHNALDSLKDCGLKCFNSVIYEDIKGKLFEALFQEIQKERNGFDIDRTILKEAVNLFVEMGMDSLSVYTRDFEAPFLAKTADFYKMESSKWVAEDSATQYMKKAEDRLNQELLRAQGYLHPTSETNLIRCVEKEILTEHQKALIEMENSGVVVLLQDQKLDDLARMYRLFARISKGLDPIAVIIKEYSTNEGMKIVKKHADLPELDFKNYVNDLIEIHDKYTMILSKVLDNNSVFQKAIKDAFEAFINQNITIAPRPAKPAAAEGADKDIKAARSTLLSTQNTTVSSSELLANYCDMLMKNTSDKMTDEDMEEVLEKVVALFGHISDKDLFQEFYRKQLSRRLLVSSTTDENERSLISKLKLKCGAPYTSKLEGMINDRNVSEETQKNFKEYIRKEGITPACEFTPQVLTTGFWPLFKIDTLDCPDQVKQMMGVFKKFYDSRTQSRVLKWVHSLGTATLIARFPKGEKELSMNAYQACICLLYNNATVVMAGDMEKQLQLSWEEIKKNLHTLAFGKYKVLIKAQPGKDIKENDEFQINDDFQDRVRKIKIPTMVAKFNPKNTQQVVQQVEEDRRHAIEACIVRLMKSRRQMEHSQLISEAITQLSQHFKPDPKVIKRRIDDLIAREYLERDSDRTNLYRYLA